MLSSAQVRIVDLKEELKEARAKIRELEKCLANVGKILPHIIKMKDLVHKIAWDENLLHHVICDCGSDTNVHSNWCIKIKARELVPL